MDTMGFLGPSGTHSEAAATWLGKGARLFAYPDIFSAMQAAAAGEVTSSLVPVENSLEGSVNVTLDALAQSDDLVIVKELVWEIHNQLMARDGSDDIRVIYSHPQPLAQCRHYLMTHFPRARLVPAPSTAKAAQIAAAEGAGTAAICTSRAGELYGLSSIASEIQDSMTNSTRFYELTRRPAPALADGLEGRALVVCQIDGKKAGSLCEVLTEFASRAVNMTRIESRPARTGPWEYMFFFDLEIEAGRSRLPLEEAIAAVRERSVWLRDFGRFAVVRK